MNWAQIKGCLNGADQTVLSFKCLPVLFSYVIDALFMFAGTIAAIIIILSGIRMILSNGDAKQLDTARKTMVYAIGGLFLIFFSYLIVNIIAYVTGVSCIMTIGPFFPTSCK